MRGWEELHSALFCLLSALSRDDPEAIIATAQGAQEAMRSVLESPPFPLDPEGLCELRLLIEASAELLWFRVLKRQRGSVFPFVWEVR